VKLIVFIEVIRRCYGLAKQLRFSSLPCGKVDGVNRIVTLVVIVALVALQYGTAQTTAAKPVKSQHRATCEKIQVARSTFLLESKAGNCTDDVERIRVQTPGKKEFVFESDGWTPFKTAFLKGERYYAAKSLVLSQFLLAVPITSAADGTLLFFLMAAPTGSSPGRLDAFAFDSSGQFSRVLSKDELHLERFVDLDGDGVREIVASPCFHQFVGPHLSTYDPFHVYKLSADRMRATLSLELTKKYNIQHYAGWAGPQCSETLVVEDHPKGKPVIRRLKDIDARR